MKQIGFIVLLAICIPSIILSPVFGQRIHTESDDYLVRVIPRYQYTNATLYETVLKLCRENDIRVCVEDIQPLSGNPQSGYSANKISGVHQNKTVMEILNTLCKEDPVYFWEYSRNGLLNVLPRTTTLGTYDNSTLSWGMNGFKIQTASFQFMLSDEFPFGLWLKQYGIQIDWIKSTTLTDIDDRLFTINLPPCSGRDGLNSMVKSAGQNYLWHLYWKSGQPVVEFVEAFELKKNK